MSNEQASMNIDPQNTIITTDEQKSTVKNLQEKISKVVSNLKPNIFNVIISFVIFLILLLLTQKLGISLLVGIAFYILIAFIQQPIIKSNFGQKLSLSFFDHNKTNVEIIETTSKSTLLLKQNKYLTCIALLKVDWSYSIVPLNGMCDFLQEEGIQIQDCREGCFLIIRKKALMKRINDVENHAKKIIKEIERTILLTKKKFDMEFENMHLHLIKGQEHIMTILNLGLLPYKFEVFNEMSDDDFEILRESNFGNQISENDKEEKL